MTGDEWVNAYCAALSVVAPSADDRAAVLALAGVAAHSSERIAAPIACWIAGREGLTLEAAMDVARDVGSG